MTRRLPSLASVAILAILIVVLVSSGGSEDDRSPGAGADRRAPAGGIRVPVERVVDGDTIEVALGGATEDVRYIGVDTPESVKPDSPIECYGPEASRFNQRLVEGETVRLDFDAERRDVYGRLLAYVYVGELFVNAELLREGYATTLTIPPNDRFARRFAELEREASAAGRGLWRECNT